MSSAALASSTCELNIDESIPSAVRLKLDRALDFLTNIEGSGANPAHRKLFGGEVSGSTYCEFLKQRVYQISYDKKNESSFAYNFGGYLMLSKQALEFDPIVLAVGLLHEAYHSNNPMEHVACPDGLSSILSGEDISQRAICDRKAMSCYGLHFIFYRNLKKHCRNCSPKEMEQAELMARIGMNRISRKLGKIRLRLGI